jgi:hypothetical protein
VTHSEHRSAAVTGDDRVVNGRHADWVPVERRWLGLDRRSLWPAAVILGVALLFAGILPTVNEAIGYDDETQPGDVMTLGSGITFEPAPGWQVESGVRVGDETVSGAAPPVKLSQGGVSVLVQVFPSQDDAATVLKNFEAISGESDTPPDFAVVSRRVAFTTASGLPGRLEQYEGAGVDGVLAVVTFPEKDLALTFAASGPNGDLDPLGTDIGTMLASVSREEAGA